MHQQAIDTETALFGVFGAPVRHSRSPLMMNRAFASVGFNGLYAAFHVEPEQLAQAVGGIRALGFRGVNVTIPHKVQVMAYLDEIDDGARQIGAVNTIVNDNGKLIGYNTDGIGYARSLQEEAGFEPSGKHIVLLGAGGAARGVAWALARQHPASLTIANRTPEKAQELALALAPYTDTLGVSYDALAGRLAQADLVVNTTSAGMHPHTSLMPLDPALLPAGALVSDLIYNPLTTRFLERAAAQGARTHGGLGMFIYQGAYAFEYWTGLSAPVQAMRQAVEHALAVNE